MSSYDDMHFILIVIVPELETFRIIVSRKAAAKKANEMEQENTCCQPVSIEE